MTLSRILSDMPRDVSIVGSVVEAVVVLSRAVLDNSGGVPIVESVVGPVETLIGTGGASMVESVVGGVVRLSRTVLDIPGGVSIVTGDRGRRGVPRDRIDSE